MLQYYNYNEELKIAVINVNYFSGKFSFKDKGISENDRKTQCMLHHNLSITRKYLLIILLLLKIILIFNHFYHSIAYAWPFLRLVDHNGSN